MRAVMEALERSGLPWYITGSVALGAYGSPRQTMAADVVIAADRDYLAHWAAELDITQLLTGISEAIDAS